jgi:hypothetical protein
MGVLGDCFDLGAVYCGSTTDVGRLDEVEPHGELE